MVTLLGFGEGLDVGWLWYVAAILLLTLIKPPMGDKVPMRLVSSVRVM